MRELENIKTEYELMMKNGFEKSKYIEIMRKFYLISVQLLKTSISK